MKNKSNGNASEKNREAMLSIVRTASVLLRASDRFFSRFQITDVQFNILMILKYDDPNGEGLSQNRISEKLVVTKSNVVGLVDRLEKAGYVTRKTHPKDRRFNQIAMTPKGRKKLEEIESEYEMETNRIMAALPDEEKQNIITGTDKIRRYLVSIWEEKK